MTDETSGEAEERTSLTHELKTWPEYFGPVSAGEKTFEARRDDRDFQEGDFLKLMEWSPEEGRYTGRWVMRRVGFVLRGGIGLFGVQAGFVIMSLLGTGPAIAENPPAAPSEP